MHLNRGSTEKKVKKEKVEWSLKVLCCYSFQVAVQSVALMNGVKQKRKSGGDERQERVTWVRTETTPRHDGDFQPPSEEVQLSGFSQ